MSADGRTRVLVVEDEPAIAELYTEWLGGEYDIRTAVSGEETLSSVAETPADVVVLDRRMPGLTGDDVARRLRETGYDCQVVMVSAVVPGPGMAALPIDEYLIKPIGKETLVDAVETARAVAKYDERIRELFALSARWSTLREQCSLEELTAP